jgi:hypothetical protein
MISGRCASRRGKQPLIFTQNEEHILLTSTIAASVIKVAGVAQVYRLGYGFHYRASISGRCNTFSVLRTIKIGSYTMNTVRLSLGLKRPDREAALSPPYGGAIPPLLFTSSRWDSSLSTGTTLTLTVQSRTKPVSVAVSIPNEQYSFFYFLSQIYNLLYSGVISKCVVG